MPQARNGSTFIMGQRSDITGSPPVHVKMKGKNNDILPREL
jgi:hypothetical protein